MRFVGWRGHRIVHTIPLSEWWIRSKRFGISAGKVTTMKKFGEMTTSMAVVARIAIITAASTGLAAVAAGVASATIESDRAIKRELAPVVWDR